jgi:tetratricopeptide (TPR) repeat protein
MTVRCAILALAIASLNSAQTPSPDPNQALKEAFAQGRAALDAKQYDQAVAALEKAAALGPGQFEDSDEAER